MSDFIKTIRGLIEIQQRAMQLSARQRQLLFLIDTPAFTQLDAAQQQRIATQELLQTLLDLQLITFKNEHAAQMHHFAHNPSPSATVMPKQAASDQRSSQTSQTSADILLNQVWSNHAVIPESPHADTMAHQPPVTILKAMPFAAIQMLMQQNLQQYCGLLAKPLMTRIAAAHSLAQLKSCQMQWITHVQESRMPPVLLSQTLQQINFAMHALQDHKSLEATAASC